MKKHGHYYKDVSTLTELDIYRFCDLYKVDDSSGCVQHAIKKLALAGQRGGMKGYRKDLEEAEDTIKRKLEMMDEDLNSETVQGLQVDPSH